jgi:hypothetical protein
MLVVVLLLLGTQFKKGDIILNLLLKVTFLSSLSLRVLDVHDIDWAGHGLD